MKHYFQNLTILMTLLTLSACAAYQIDTSVTRYNAVADRVQLGDSIDNVLALLKPTQSSLPQKNRKNSDKYYKDNVMVEIHYFRTGRQPDGLTTDDEFTPYIFNDGKLVGIGWQMLGGAKSFGKVVQPAPVTNLNQTIVY